MKLGALFSGGKDSTYAIYVAKQRGHTLECLISMMPYSLESYLFHYPNISWTKLQAEAMCIPIINTNLTRGNKEIQDLVRTIKFAKEHYDIEGIIAGGLASVYQKERFEAASAKEGLTYISPFWLEDPEKYINAILRDGFTVMVVGVAAEGLDKSWLGRIINEDIVDKIKELNRKFNVHVAFEGGEAETFVLDCPLFSRKIEIIDMRKHWYGDHGFLEIKKAKLVSKNFNFQKS